MKRILLFFLFIVISFFFTPIAKADFSVIPPVGQINDQGGTASVTITFTGLIDGHKYYVCPSTRKCGIGDFLGLRTNATEKIAQNGTITINVCGAGNIDVKLVDGSCGPNDYFHSNTTYDVKLFDGYNSDAKLIQDVPLPIAHFYPSITFTAIDSNGAATTSPTPNSTYKVSISGQRVGGDTRNNYEIEIRAQDSSTVRDSTCIILKSPSQDFALPWNLEAGRYTFFLRDQKDDTAPLNLTLDPFAHTHTFIANCEPGFTYYAQDFEVSATGGQMGELASDPNHEDTQRIKGGLPIPTTPPDIIPPCSNRDVHGSCTQVSTAIGNVGTNAQSFIQTVMGLLLGVSGGIAIVLIIMGAYKLMTSQGEEEKIKEAREGITSAVIGLLFIIFSLVIFQIIGVDILRIPGLG